MANDIRDRNWFITVNKEAKCFQDIQSIIEKSKPVWFALILHDRDNEKQEHYHLVIKYKDAKTFSAIQNIFEGGHIEKVQDINASTQYLLHLNDPMKEQYFDYEIITNDKNLTSRYLQAQTILEQFNPNMLDDYVSVDGLTLYIQFVRRFGVEQVKKYRADINQCIEDRYQERKALKDYKQLMAKKELP